MTARYRAAAIRLNEVTDAVQSGANTYRTIATALNVPVNDPDLAATLNFMLHQQRIEFVPGCCAPAMEHTYDCEMRLP